VGDALDDLKEAESLLESNGVQVSARDHHASKSLYFKDPDGNPLEFYIDTSEDWKADPDIIGWNGLEPIT
jgi:catechol 2,3-dioxygenase